MNSGKRQLSHLPFLKLNMNAKVNSLLYSLVKIIKVCLERLVQRILQKMIMNIHSKQINLVEKVPSSIIHKSKGNSL